MIQNINDDLIPQNIKTNSILRDTYIKYQELLQRGKLRLKVNKQINFDIGQQLYFFRNKDTLFFQHPDKQQEYYEELIKKLSKEIKPQQSLSYHKQINLEIQQLNKQKYTPDTLKQEIIRYFKQKIKELKIRKQRTFLEEQNLTQPLNDKIYKARVQWIDNQIINLGERLQRIQVDDGIKNYYETSQQLFSNLNLEDIEIFIRNKIWQRKVKQPLQKIESMCKWMHFLDRFTIQENQNKILNQRRKINQERNQKYFNDISEAIKDKLKLKYQMSIEVTLQLFEYMKPLKFEQEVGRPIHRYDRIPLMIFTDDELQNRLLQIAGTFLKFPKQFGQQKLIFHLSNLQHMLDGYQKYLYSWDGTQKNEYEGHSGLQKLTIELSAFDDSEELINSLLNPLPIYPEVRLQLVQNDWKYLLDNKNLVFDEYQIYIQNQLNFVTIDNLTEKIIRLLPIHYNKQMQIFIDQHIKQQRQDNYKLFNIIENFDYIEKTRESLRLSQINELYEHIQSQEIFYRHKTKFKSDLVKAFEELMVELTPKESLHQAYLNTIVCKIREYYRKIFYIINAIQSIERKLTFSLLSIRDCKVNNIIDEQFLQKANLQTKQSENKIFDSTKHRRKAIISFCDAYQNVADKYINDFKNIKYEDQIFYKDEEMPDVFIKQKQINPIYDSANDEYKIIQQRLIQQISLYINKYEKLSSIKNINPIIDRFQCVLDCFEEESKYQFQKLQLLQVYMIVFDNTINQQNQYQILDRMFEIMKQIPLLDLESFYFQDSYKLNQQMFIEERQLLKTLIDNQIKHEYNMIQQINDDYFSLKQQQINKQDILSKEQTPKETQRNNLNQDSRLDEQYDYYNLSNKMSQIFQELNTSNKKSEHNFSQNKESNNQIDYNAVLLPFQIYDEFTNINFYESLNQTIQIIQSTKRSYKQLIQQFPQTSMQEYLSLQISCIQQAQIYVNQENKQPQIKKFNENTFIESHFGLVPKYLEHIKQTINSDLSSYIMNISLYDLDKALNQQNFNISDIWAISNLFEYMRLRKHFFDSQLEMKMHHRIHKRILNYEKMSKTADFYYKSNLSDIQSQYKKQQSIKYCFSPFCFEVDATQEIAFIQLKQPELLVFQDIVEEFRNIILYDRINAVFLKTQNELRYAFLDEYYKTQIDLKQYSKTGYLPQNSKLTIKILSQFDFNEKQILASLQRKPEDIDSFLILPKVIKAELFNKYLTKFKDRPLIQSQSEKMQILGQKKDQNLKNYLIKRLIKDFHQIVCYEAQKVEIQYKDFHIKKLISIFPNNSKQIKLQELNQIIPQQYKQFGEKLETHIQIDYFYSKDDFNFDKYQDQITQQRKHLKRYEQYLIEILRHNTIHLNWFETMHINELYLFNLEFDNYDQTKEMLYQGKLNKNPIKSLLEYDKNHFDINQCTSELQIDQKPLVAQGIDKMIDKIKCYYQINKVFESYKENLSKFQKIEHTKELKENYIILYKQTFYLYHQTQFLISKDFSDSDYVQQFRIIRQYLFLQHRMNSINLKHYNTYFVQDFPIYKVNSQKSLIHFKNKHSNNFKNQLQSILQLLPLNEEKQLTFYQTECHQNISQMIQIPGIIGINERIMLRKQNIDDIKDFNNTMLIETYILLQTKFPFKIGGVDVKYHYNQLEQKQKQKIQLKELVYRQLVNTSIRALDENVNLLQQYINIVPQYVQKDDVMQKLVSKINIAIPRVQFIQSLQNTLSSKNNVIPSSLKQSFIQGFLNRLKNKSIQTNMLVSGIGYSISSQDIEDCINILNRDMYTFAENEISARMETFNLVYEQQQFQIKQLKRELQQTKLENQQLKQSFDEQLQTMVIAKSNKILFELEMFKQKFNDYQRCTQGLEQEVYKQIDNKYKVQIEQLTFERDQVLQKFIDLKQQLITLFTQEIQINEETLIKFIQQKTNEMLCEIPLYRKVQTIIIDQNDQQNKQNSDLLFDPYKFTKALHQYKDKLQQQNIDQKINYEKQISDYKQQCNNYENIKLQLNESKKRENTMKMELIILQQTINQLIKQKDELTEQIDQLKYDKKRLLKSNEDMQQQVKQYKDKYKNQDNRRRNAISVENYSMTQSIVERKTLPKLFKSEQKPKLKL